ncbi:MAG TPA: AI-2E family transporter [Gemmatimonadales bacterium]|nr:AI-2E family transporter [Gemmatimonadales bacterium]
MTHPAPPRSVDQVFDVTVNVVLRLAVLATLILLTVLIVRPFAFLLIWAIILAVALASFFERLVALLRRRGLAGVVLSLLGTLLIAVPLFLAGPSLLAGARGIRSQLEGGTLVAPPPNAAVRKIPVVGTRVYDAWTLAHDDMQQAVTQFEPQIRAAGEWATGFLKSVGGAALQTLLALFIASVLLTYRAGVTRFGRAVAVRVAPGAGADYLAMAGATINSVTLGVLGVAAIQALGGGIVFKLVGIPAAGLLALVLFVAAVIQLPTLIVLLLPAAWGILNLSGLPLIGLIIGCVVIGIADTPLKAVFLGRGLPVPTWVILVGAIGGMISMGMMGLFLGAIALGLAYRLLLGWTGQGTPADTPADRPEAGETAQA